MAGTRDLVRQQQLRRKNLIWLFVLLGVVAMFYVVFMLRAGQF